MAEKLTFIRSILIVFLIAISTALIEQKGDKKEFPNILFIAVDDLRPEINAYGAKHMKTPNIDRLAGEGVMFERAYFQQAICMASRTSILSGLRPEYKKLYNCDALVNLAPEVLTLNEHFDEGKKDKGPAYEMLDVPDNYYLDGINAEHAIKKLKEYRKSDQPFFLGFGLHNPHLPWCAPKKYWDMYTPEMIELSPVADYPEGLTPYSLTNWGDHGWKLGDRNAWSKHTNFEYDTRVPIIISAPGMTNKGKSTRSFAEFVDIYPTLCELAGIPLPGHLQGQSLVTVLWDTDKNIRDYALSIFPRDRTEDAKTITGFSIRTDDYRYTEWIHLQSGKTMASELYDHQKDPMETKNVVNENSYREAAKKLSTLLHRLYDDAISGIERWTGVSLYDPADLEMAKTLAKIGKSPYAAAVDSLKAEADRLLDDGPWSVMQKNKVPPSGNMHDYYSLVIWIS
jgi:iduronate 2-sulfatase